MTYKRYEYWSKNGKTYTKCFPLIFGNYITEYQMNDRRVFCRLLNEYKDENIRTSS